MFAARLSALAGLAALVFAVSVDAQAGKKTATIILKLPEDDAKVEIEGSPYKGTGYTRRFTTPELKPGEHFYTVKIVFEPSNYETITRIRKVPVEAGKEVTLDLTKADVKQPDHIVIRYVPTPQAVVDRMLKLGKAGKDDIVYDLGCGDGRIVVTAVSKFGVKRGVGIDLDPRRIKECQKNAKQATVEDRVEFRLGDVMKVEDLGKATLVTLYLADSLNEQLLPILKKQCKPGTRIVSHRFLMGSYKPDKTEEMRHDGSRYKLHLWTLGKPAKGKIDRKDD